MFASALPSPEAQSLKFASSPLFTAQGGGRYHVFGWNPFGCQAKEEMFCSPCEGIVRETVPILEFSIYDSMCLCVILCF